MQKKFGKAFDFHPDTFQVTLKSLLAMFVSQIGYILEAQLELGLQDTCDIFSDKVISQLPAEHDQLVKRMEEEKCTKVVFQHI